MKIISFLLAAAIVVFSIVPVSAVPSNPQTQPVIIIDPGHGGEDGGTTGISGTKEADVNLSVSLCLRDLLRVLGCSTILTRETDQPVGEITGATVHERKAQDLKNRVSFVNSVKNAVLVSIHQNFFEQSKYDGAQVFYADTTGSKALAETMQQTLREVLDKSNRREAKPSEQVYLMEHIRCPAVLIECGFLSNAREEALLNTSSYQQKIAAAIAQALFTQVFEGANDL